MYIVRIYIYISQILYMNLILKDTVAYILNKIKKIFLENQNKYQNTAANPLKLKFNCNDSKYQYEYITVG